MMKICEEKEMKEIRRMVPPTLPNLSTLVATLER